MKSIYEGVKHSCDYKTTRKSLQNLSMMELNIVVSFVNIRKIHVKSIQDRVKYGCEFCEYKTTSKGSRQVHVKYIHDGVKHSCEFYD